ncbi:MAG: glycosyltransferase family 2 protein, partial [Actinomycetes bacterium]
MAEIAAEDLRHVTAILVVHDGALWLPQVVASLTSQKRSVDQILAVDTGSTDSSVALLKGAKIPVLSLDRESGFGDAIWAAIQTLPAPTSPENEWLWILHDDCAMHPEALEKLLDALAQKPQAIMAGPKLLGWHDKSHLLEIGVSIASDGARWTGLEPREYDQGQHDGVHDVLAVSTAGALVRRDAFVELGGFDPNLSLFRDDVDFGWRARVAGHSVIAVSEAKGFHAQAAASERRSADVKEAFLHR